MLNRSVLGGWFFGFFFGLYAVGAVSQGNFLSGIAGLAFTSLIIPPFRHALFARLPWVVPGWAKVGITAGVFLIMAMTVEAEAPPQPTSVPAVSASPVATAAAQPRFSPTASPAGQLTPPSFATPAVLAATSSSHRQAASLVRVVDGDTIQVELDGQRRTVRIIGLDTPEVVDPRRSVECFGREASNEAKRFLTEVGPQLWLEADPSQSDRDRYGRLLRYVFVNQAQDDYGLRMITQGYASEYTYDQPHRYQASYRAAEAAARAAGRGLWSEEACGTSTRPNSQPATQLPNEGG